MNTPGSQAETQSSGASSDAGPPLNLRRYWEILLKRKWLVLGVAAIVLAGVSLFTFRQVKIYEAKITVLVDQAAPQVLGGNVREVVDLGTGSYWMSRDYLASQNNIIKSRELASRVVDTLKLQETPEF